MKIPIEISARHLHLSMHDLDILFGPNYSLSNFKEVSQPGQFATEETVKLVGPKGQIEKVRIVGPIRKETQVELSITDCFKLGTEPKIAVSGELDNSAGGLKIVGVAGEVNLEKGVIVAQRHLHISPTEAAKAGLKHLDTISVKINGVRDLILNNIVVRSREGIDKLALHLDTDEANAAAAKDGQQGELVK
ncbi:MAG: phosphate propanoyltransferase [Candidatus Kerfeldbacteria bacterium]